MVKELIKEMEDAIGNNLISVVKFGSEGEPNNLLLVLDSIDFAVLNEIKPIVIKYRKKNKVVPLIFTKEELFEGADVFPLEFLDIQQPHKTIYGEELVSKIKIDKRHVRRQLEFEFRSKLIHLRESYIGIKNDKELQNLLLSAVPSLMPLFYGLLFLKDIKAPFDLDALFGLVIEQYSVSLDILKKIKQVREGNIKVKNEELNGFIKELVTLLTEFGDIVDKMGKNNSEGDKE